MANRKFTVTPIGSCRIASPSRAGMETHGVTVTRPRSYGFTHSSSEAVQQARFMVEGGSIPTGLWPMIGRDNDYAKIHGAVFKPADLYLIEISSAKTLRLDDHLIQLNYTQHHFRDFFSDPARAAKYWELVNAGETAELGRFLDAEWSGSEAPRHDSDLLRRIELVRTTDDILRADLNALRELLGRDIVVVTHVNARDENGNVLGARDSLIRQVRRVAEEEGFEVSDPTGLMEKYGQENVISNHSGAYAHYQESFFPLLFAQWYEAYMRPRIDSNAAESGAVPALTFNLAARLAQGAHEEVAARIAALPPELRARREIEAIAARCAAAGASAL